MEKSKKRLLVVFLIVFVSMIAIGLSKPALTFKVKSLEMGSSFLSLKIGLLTSMFMIFRAIGSAIFTKIKRKRITATLGFIIFSLCFTAYNLSNNYAAIVLLKPLEGLVAGLTWPLIQLLVGAVSPESYVVTSMTLYFAIGKLGGQVGNIIYGLLNSISLSLTLATLLMFAISPLVFKTYVEDGKKAPKRSTRIAMDVSPSLIYLSALTAGFNLGLMMEITLYYLNAVKELSEAQASILYGVVGIAVLLFPVFQGYLADKFSGRFVILLSLLLICIGGSTLALSSVKGIFAGIPLIFYTSGVSSIQSLSRGLALKTENQQKTLGYANVYGNIGASVSPIIGGVLLPYRFSAFDSAFLVFGVVLALATLLILVKSKQT
ncbi:MAG: hypothetical protein DRN88_00570 [Candidatus Hydrothermarchaeota archaeon]|nr:MAG: hypothetical protein DRN88_00570 [Candidatus Hydrothermarchaeota archaeon]